MEKCLTFALADFLTGRSGMRERCLFVSPVIRMREAAGAALLLLHLFAFPSAAFFSPSGSSASFSFTSAQEPQQPQHPSPHHPPSALLLCGKYLSVSAIFSKIIPPIPTFALRLRRAHCRIRLSGGRHCLCPSAAGTVGGAVCSRGESLT